MNPADIGIQLRNRGFRSPTPLRACLKSAATRTSIARAALPIGISILCSMSINSVSLTAALMNGSQAIDHESKCIADLLDHAALISQERLQNASIARRSSIPLYLAFFSRL